MRSPIYRALVAAAREHLAMVDQWRNASDPANPDWLETATNYANRAEALIGFLEVQLCGSFGGFDKGQKDADRRTLDVRLDWVERKL